MSIIYMEKSGNNCLANMILGSKNILIMNNKNENRIVVLILLVYSMATRFFTSLYSIRFDKDVMQGDGTCFYLIGKAIMQGKVLYKDIFDHKTPYIYFINGFASLIDYNHIGLFVIETIILFISLYYVYKILLLVFRNKTNNNLSNEQCQTISLIGSFLIGIVLCNNDIVEGYYRTEPFAVALILPAVYILAKYYYNKTNIKEITKQMHVIGILAGLTFMINIKAAVLFVPIVIPLTLDYIKQKEWIGLLKAFCFGLTGVILAILPYIIYMVITKSASDMLFAVVNTNLIYARDYMEYNVGTELAPRSTKDGFIKLAILFFTKFPIPMSLIFISLVILLFNKYNCRFKIAICLQFISAFIITLLAGRLLAYYLYILLPYMVVIYVYIINVFVSKVLIYLKNLRFRFKNIVIICLSFALFLGVNYYINNKLICTKADKILNDARELQNVAAKYDSNYSELKILGVAYIPDIYLWLDKDIDYKYFARPSITYNSFNIAYDEQTRYISDLDPDIIIVRHFALFPQHLEMRIKFILNYYYDLIGETDEFYLFGKKRQ